jgi:hypothetical protein
MSCNSHWRGRLDRWLLATVLALATVVASAGWREQLPDARLVGRGVFRYFGFRIYDAELWSPSGALSSGQPYALVLTYHHDIDKARFIDTSVDEIVRTQGGKASASQLAAWRQLMALAFVDIRAGEQMAALFRPGQGVRFFHDSQQTADVDDPAFAAAFAGIWLSKGSRDPALRAALLGNTGTPP